MTYIGSGKLASIINGKKNCGDIIVWGRRLKNTKLSDLKYVKNSQVVYLDTIDLHSLDSTFLKLRFLFTLYKLEKILMRIILKLWCSKLCQIHIPIISESNAWKNLTDRNGQRVYGLTYNGVIDLIEYVVESDICLITSTTIKNMLKNNKLEKSELNVSQSLSLKMVKNLKSC